MKYTGHYCDNKYESNSLTDIQDRMLVDMEENDFADYETAWIFNYSTMLNRWIAQYYYSQIAKGWQVDEIEFWSTAHWYNAIQPLQRVMLNLVPIFGKVDVRPYKGV